MSDSALTPAPPAPPGQPLDLARLGGYDTDTLVAALVQGLGLTVQHLVYVAAIWKEVESRGKDLSHLRQGIGAFLPAIAAGDCLPETVVNFAGKPAVMKKVAALPPAVQRDIADGKLSPPAVQRDIADGKLSPPAARQNRATVARTGPSNPTLPGQPPREQPPRAGEPTDAELDAAAERQPVRKPLEMLAAMIGNASPGDAAELVADCVRGCPSPAAVAQRLLPLLEQIARFPQRRPPAV